MSGEKAQKRGKFRQFRHDSVEVSTDLANKLSVPPGLKKDISERPGIISISKFKSN